MHTDKHNTVISRWDIWINSKSSYQLVEADSLRFFTNRQRTWGWAYSKVNNRSKERTIEYKNEIKTFFSV